MYHDAVVRTYLVLELSDSFKKWLALYVTDSTTYFDDGNLGALGIGISVKSVLYLIGDVGNNLDGVSAKITVSFFLKNAPVNLTGCYI